MPSPRTEPPSIVKQNIRPEPDRVLQDIADYVQNHKITSKLAWETARFCLLDALGCGLEALNFEQCTNLLGPVVEGTVVPNGTRVPGTPYQLDPIRGAFNIGMAIGWLDYNDSYLSAECGHPSDNLGGILAVADWLARTNKAKGLPAPKIKDVLEAMIKAYEIQGCLAVKNSFNRAGLDHVVLVKVATTAVVSKMLGLNRKQIIDAVSQAWVDGQPLRTYRHVPNTMSRKSWAAGDACSRAVNLALLVRDGVGGIPSVLTAKTWGFYDVLFKSKGFEFYRPYGSIVMENVLFKPSYPGESHSQPACDAAMRLHNNLKKIGKTADDIASICIRIQREALNVIDKRGHLYNYADRDHCIQYMVAVLLIFGRLTTQDYSDETASDPRIDALREKIVCVRGEPRNMTYSALDTCYNGGATIKITLKDDTIIDEVAVWHPVGHTVHRAEGIPLLLEKFERHVTKRLGKEKTEEILKSSVLEKLNGKDVDEYVDLYITKENSPIPGVLEIQDFS